MLTLDAPALPFAPGRRCLLHDGTRRKHAVEGCPRSALSGCSDGYREGIRSLASYEADYSMGCRWSWTGRRTGSYA